MYGFYCWESDPANIPTRKSGTRIADNVELPWAYKGFFYVLPSLFYNLAQLFDIIYRKNIEYFLIPCTL
jgi:hypothetical protein